MHEEIADSRMLVVGGSAGIGSAVTRLARRRGARVIVASRNPARAGSEDADETLAVDITSPDDRRRLFREVGSIDHLVVTVRPAVESAPFPSIDAADARQAFETKFWGTYELIQVARPHLRKTGSITLTSGIAGERVYPGASTMALVNTATETLCRVLAVELAPLRVNAVSPGFVEPKPVTLQERAGRFPVPRLASPDEVASAYLSLIANPYVTGSVTVVDGGARLV